MCYMNIFPVKSLKNFIYLLIVIGEVVIELL